jgi:hypothetical protein
MDATKIYLLIDGSLFIDFIFCSVQCWYFYVSVGTYQIKMYHKIVSGMPVTVGGMPVTVSGMPVTAVCQSLLAVCQSLILLALINGRLQRPILKSVLIK